MDVKGALVASVVVEDDRITVCFFSFLFGYVVLCLTQLYIPVSFWAARGQLVFCALLYEFSSSVSKISHCVLVGKRDEQR